MAARDLERHVLRHVTEAFAEDPLRVFRVARFAAQLQGFNVHPDTRSFMAGMAESLAELPAERVWGEFRKALAAPAPATVHRSSYGLWLPIALVSRT